jgi:hypothetical protein
MPSFQIQEHWIHCFLSSLEFVQGNQGSLHALIDRKPY